MELAIEEQIKILIEAKDIYLTERVGNSGMCSCIRSAILNRGYGHWYSDVSEFIPSFNRQNIVNLTIGTELEPYLLRLFWDVSDREIRPKVFDILINQLINQKNK